MLKKSSEWNVNRLFKGIKTEQKRSQGMFLGMALGSFLKRLLLEHILQWVKNLILTSLLLKCGQKWRQALTLLFLDFSVSSGI